MKTHHTIGTWLKRHRMMSGKTQSEIAQDVGYCSGQIISNIERGKAHPSDEVIANLCRTQGWNFSSAKTILLEHRKHELNNVYRKGI